MDLFSFGSPFGEVSHEDDGFMSGEYWSSTTNYEASHEKNSQPGGHVLSNPNTHTTKDFSVCSYVTRHELSQQLSESHLSTNHQVYERSLNEGAFCESMQGNKTLGELAKDTEHSHFCEKVQSQGGIQVPVQQPYLYGIHCQDSSLTNSADNTIHNQSLFQSDRKHSSSITGDFNRFNYMEQLYHQDCGNDKLFSSVNPSDGVNCSVNVSSSTSTSLVSALPMSYSAADFFTSLASDPSYHDQHQNPEFMGQIISVGKELEYPTGQGWCGANLGENEKSEVWNPDRRHFHRQGEELCSFVVESHVWGSENQSDTSGRTAEQSFYQAYENTGGNQESSFYRLMHGTIESLPIGDELQGDHPVIASIDETGAFASERGFDPNRLDIQIEREMNASNQSSPVMFLNDIKSPSRNYSPLSWSTQTSSDGHINLTPTRGLEELNTSPLSMMHRTLSFGSLISDERQEYHNIEQSPKSNKRLKRPMNAYLLFCAEWREKCRHEDPFNDTRELATKLGELWRSLPELQKTQYNRMAEELKSNFLQENPNYRFTRRKKARKDGTDALESPESPVKTASGARKRLFS